MKKKLIGLVILIGSVFFLVHSLPVQAANPDFYHWWLISWSTKEIGCDVKISHAGNPTSEEIKIQCSEKVYQSWVSAPPCQDILHSSKCEGYYLLLGQAPEPTKTPTALPTINQPTPTATSLPTTVATLEPTLAPTTNSPLNFIQPQQPLGNPFPDVEKKAVAPFVEVALNNCSFPSQNRCDELPQLILHGRDGNNLGYVIEKIEGFYDSQYFLCQTEWCQIQINPSKNATGDTFEFWTQSTSGIISPHYRILANVNRTKRDAEEYWEVHFLSETFYLTDETILNQSWLVLPTSANNFPLEMQNVLLPPINNPNYQNRYLAGRLINMGKATYLPQCAPMVHGNGLATDCGLEAAQKEVTIWQQKNQQIIWEYAVSNSIPPQLLQNVFDYESSLLPLQHPYWDITTAKIKETGIPFMTKWYPFFFDYYCPAAINIDFCRNTTFDNLGGMERQMVINTIIGGDSTCPYCPYSTFPEEKKGTSVEWLTKFLVAFGREVGATVTELTNKEPGKAINYSDLWYLTLADYYGGIDCIKPALQNTLDMKLNLTWENIKYNLSPQCWQSVQAVEQIIR